jgi:hypothetical protein
VKHVFKSQTLLWVWREMGGRDGKGEGERERGREGGRGNEYVRAAKPAG